MRFRIKILTPVHIGSGEEISPLEYYIHNEKFIRLDMDGLFSDSEFKPIMGKFINSAGVQRNIGELIPQELLLRHPLYKLDISTSARDTRPIVVKEFIKSAGRVYIPGSSLKGSILSGVIYWVAKKENIRDIRDYEGLLAQVLGKSSTFNMGKFSHWLDITDTNFSSPEEALEVTLSHVEGGRGAIPILYESLKVGCEFTVELKTSINSLHKFGAYKEEDILRMADEFYKRVYEREKKSKISQNLPRFNSSNYLLRLGQGSTCLSTSLLLLAEELGIKDYKLYRRNLPPIKIGEEPSTRKLIHTKTPLGWIEVKGFAT